MKRICVIILCSLSLLACKNTQHLGSKATDPNDLLGSKVEMGSDVSALLQQVADSCYQYQTFSANFSAVLNMPDFNQSVTGQIRMIYDSLIWISAGKFGIEAFRILINKDSVYILNKLEQTLKVHHAGILREYLSNFSQLRHFQNILLGNPIVDVFGTNCELNIMGQNYVFSQKPNEIFPYRITLEMDSTNYKVKEWNILNRADKKASIKYVWLNSKTNILPSEIFIETEFPISLSVGLTYTKVNVNEPINTPFPIPDKVQRL